jgi:ribosomal protein L22
MKALLTNYRQSPRKVRLIADMIRGKSVMEAKAALMFAVQRITGSKTAYGVEAEGE